ncbi:MAG TPA: thiamine pyrophosphate-binding protein, partial [Burkholderiales bacterium]
MDIEKTQPLNPGDNKKGEKKAESPTAKPAAPRATDLADTLPLNKGTAPIPSAARKAAAEPKKAEPAPRIEPTLKPEPAAPKPEAAPFKPETAADAWLGLLAARGIEYLFSNGGTDFAPVVEAYAKGQKLGWRLPQIVIVPHENMGVAMAHGYAMVTGKPQAM